uniref:Major facilitator superfamily (MFS) profile domain-containing protein n=2 Tax=Aplanochytrium stocchinoi TaxID=215587 RepID=A0A6S8BXZ1_9STRA
MMQRRRESDADSKSSGEGLGLGLDNGVNDVKMAHTHSHTRQHLYMLGDEKEEETGLVTRKSTYKHDGLEAEIEDSKCRNELYERVPFFTLLGLNSFVFAYALITVTLSMLVLPAESEHMFPENQAVGLAGLLGIAGVSQLVCPVAGFFSDRNTSRYGRRRPFATLGIIIGLLSLTVLYVLRRNFRTGTTAAFADPRIQIDLNLYRAVYVCAFSIIMISLNVSYASYAGLVPDLVPDVQYGEASGAMALQTTLGSLVGVSLIGFVEVEPYRLYMFTITSVWLWMWCGVKEERHIYDSTRDNIGCNARTLKSLINVYSISVKREPDFFFVWVSRLLYYTGMSAQAFMQYFLRDVLGREDDALIQTALVTMIAMASGSLVSIPCGVFSDRLGKRKPLVYLSCVIMSITFVGWIGAHHMIDVFLWAGVFGVANGTYLSVDYALACATMPDRGENARFLAVWGVAAFIGSTLGPFICGPALYLIGESEDSFHYRREGYAAVLLIGASFVLISALVLRCVTVA